MKSERLEVEQSRRAQPDPSTAEDIGNDPPDSEKRRLSRSSDDEAMLGGDPSSSPRLEDLPTEPRHALPTTPDVDWDTPTIPDGKTLDSWDIDERG